MTTTTRSSKHILSAGLAAAATLIAVLPFFGTANKESSGEVR